MSDEDLGQPVEWRPQPDGPTHADSPRSDDSGDFEILQLAQAALAHMDNIRKSLTEFVMQGYNSAFRKGIPINENALRALLRVEELKAQVNTLDKEIKRTKRRISRREHSIADLKVENIRLESEVGREWERYGRVRIEFDKRVVMEREASIASAVASVASGFADNMTTLTVLKTATQAKLAGRSPFSLAKIGRIIRAMQESPYQFNDDEVDLVVYALYASDDVLDLQDLFDFLDAALSDEGIPAGFLSSEKFRNILPLLGEAIDPDKVDDFFREIDRDGSGEIEFSEFQTLVRRLNPNNTHRDMAASLTRSPELVGSLEKSS